MAILWGEQAMRPIGEQLETAMYTELIVFAGLIARARARGDVLNDAHAYLLKTWSQVARDAIIGSGYSAFERTTIRRAAVRLLRGCEGDLP